ncbi:MAG: hypothetical protein OEZ06_00080 [Myxococcales bacterium]|nr:hypothetical protein [Myxococcales bacterium]
MESDIANLRGRVMGLTGMSLGDADVVKLLSDVLSGGGGVQIHLDDTGFKLTRREGKFVITREPRAYPSNTPPRM